MSSTKQSFRPARLVGGLLLIAAGIGVAFYVFGIYEGRIRIVPVLALIALLVLGGGALAFASVQRVCARCGNDVDHLELAFEPAQMPLVQQFANTGQGAELLASSRKVSQHDQQRAILVVDGCMHCPAYAQVKSHYAVWQGQYFDVQHPTPWRELGPAEQHAVHTIVNSRL